MPRLFLGIDLPDDVDLDLRLTAGGVPGARWLEPEQLHLTLHFLGDVDGGTMRELVDALDELRAPAFDMRLSGAGAFPPRGPSRVLWVGVADGEPVRVVHERTGRIIDRVGIEREHRKFHPHVTVARLDRAPKQAVAEWVMGHSLYSSATFRVDKVRLYSSVLAREGAKYRVEAAIPLQ